LTLIGGQWRHSCYWPRRDHRYSHGLWLDVYLGRGVRRAPFIRPGHCFLIRAWSREQTEGYHRPFVPCRKRTRGRPPRGNPALSGDGFFLIEFHIFVPPATICPRMRTVKSFREINTGSSPPETKIVPGPCPEPAPLNCCRTTGSGCGERSAQKPGAYWWPSLWQ